MVPGAIEADLDLVAGELIVCLGQLHEPLPGIDHPAAVALELRAVDVAHAAQGLVGTDRTGEIELLADVLRRPQ